MSILSIVSKAGRNFHTVMLTAAEKDGLVKTTEVEPYVYRCKDGNDLLYCYDTNEDDMKILMASKIISVEETNNTFSPKYPVRV